MAGNVEDGRKDERQEHYLKGEPEESSQWVMTTPRYIRMEISDWDPFSENGCRVTLRLPFLAGLMLVASTNDQNTSMRYKCLIRD